MADWTEKNRSHFNDSASTYNAKFSKTILQIIDEIQQRRHWIGADSIELDTEKEDESSASDSPSQKKNLRLLDYACGTGLVSRALVPYVSQCVGLDISESMVHEYNTSARNQGIDEAEMSAHLGNLLDPDSVPESLAGPEYHGFDVAAVGMGFHHFPDPGLAAKRLADRLKAGGVLFIVDFLPHDDPNGHSHGHGSHGHSHGHDSHGHAVAKTVIHFGFSEEDVKGYFEAAGVGGKFEYVVLGKGVVFSHDAKEHKRSLFMARGVKL